MREWAAALAGIVLIVGSLQDAFEVVLLPRRVQRRLRLMYVFFRATWAVWSRLGARLPIGTRRETFLSIYGPLSMVLLFSLWALCLIAGFGLLQWGLKDLAGAEGEVTLIGRMYMSGEAFFTLGYGDAVPQTAISRLLVITEAGTGFGFIALTISYLPVLYQHFSQRDVQLIQLAARAGSPATAATLLLRFAGDGTFTNFDLWLRDWELWAANLVESHSSYPMLAFYRSQHRNHSWLASLGVLLDCCTLIIARVDDMPLLQAAATFSAARRVLDEMSGSLGVNPSDAKGSDRFPSPGDLFALERKLADFGVHWIDDEERDESLLTLRATYEPQLVALAAYLLLPLSGWMEADELRDWEGGRGRLVQRLLRNEADPGE